MWHAATAALLIVSLLIVAYVISYTVAYPWWRSRTGRTLVGWPLTVGILTGVWATDRLIGHETPSNVLIIAGCVLLAAAAIYKFSFLLETIGEDCKHRRVRRARR